MIRIRFEAMSLEGFADEVLEELRPQAEEAARAGAEAIRAHADRLLSRQGPPVAGAPPAEVEGDLRRSLTTTKPSWNGKHTVYADAGIPGESPGGDYAARQEFGGTDKAGSVLPPHPYMRPSVIAAEAVVDGILEDER